MFVRNYGYTPDTKEPVMQVREDNYKWMDININDAWMFYPENKEEEYRAMAIVIQYYNNQNLLISKEKCAKLLLFIQDGLDKLIKMPLYTDIYDTKPKVIGEYSGKYGDVKVSGDITDEE